MNILIAILILLIYTITLIKIGGQVPPSLSDSVFDIPTKHRWIWTVVIIAVCFLAVPTYIDKTRVNTQFLAFLSIGGLAFVGAAPLVKFKDDALQFRVHEVGAIACAVCSQILLAFNCSWLLLLWIPFMAYGFANGWKTWKTMIFWGEMVCFSSTFIYCLI